MSISSTENNKFTLLTDEVHLWHTVLPDTLSSDASAACLACLDREEQTRADRCLSRTAQDLYIAAHAFQRSVLSLYAPVLPEAWIFPRDANGRPEIVASQNPESLRFNLSHTHGLAALAICRKTEIGVDAEYLHRSNDIDALALRYFAEEEISQLQAESDPMKKRRLFFTIWTLKESFVKALGIGLRVSLTSFAFQVSFENRAALLRSSLEGGAPDCWQFQLERPTESHLLSLACRNTTTRLSHYRMSLHDNQWHAEIT